MFSEFKQYGSLESPQVWVYLVHFYNEGEGQISVTV